MLSELTRYNMLALIEHTVSENKDSLFCIKNLQVKRQRGQEPESSVKMFTTKIRGGRSTLPRGI